MSGYIGATTFSFDVTEADIKGDIKSTDASPEVTLQNTTEEDTDGGRESKITFKGEQSGGEITTLAQIQASHDGTADDEKGDLIFSTNDGADGNAPTERVRIDADGNVGIGTSSPSQQLHIESGDAQAARMRLSNTEGYAEIGANNSSLYIDADTHIFRSEDAASEYLRIGSTGQLLIGRTATSGVADGHRFDATGFTQHVRDGNSVLELSRGSSEGVILVFKSGTSTIGELGVVGGDLFAGTGDTNLRYNDGGDDIRPASGSGAGRDNAIDLGDGSARFDDIFATNGTIQTSDRNEKQDIAELDEAEKRVAVAAKGLIRKYRWIDAVQEKGDDARIHVGIIAQDLQAAFEAEGLDASRYAMFISSTWWEADETYTDDDGVEQTRTNTYETQEEAPEGATKRTRLGVRYPELLAFIIGAL